jgi:2-methylcitrate dehydratase
MDKALQNEKPDGPVNSRRRFLQQLATAGATVTASALPAMAQENPERPRAGNGSPERRSAVAEALADYAVRLRYEDLPADVVRTAKRTILDTIGCAIGGYQAGPSRIAINLAAKVSATPGATVLCSGIKTSHELAVFANGVMIRYLDFNDGYIDAHGRRPSERHPRGPALLRRDRRAQWP